MKNIIYLRYKTSNLNEEVNCSEPFPSISVPCNIILTSDYHNQYIFAPIYQHSAQLQLLGPS
jgi:hypothetical protein